MHKILSKTLIILGLSLALTACNSGSTPVNSQPANAPSGGLATLPVNTAISLPTKTSLPPTAMVVTPTLPAAAAAVGPTQLPPPPAGIPEAVLPASQPLSRLVAFAWNNLGMHCYQADYSQLLILPPYNVLCTQVVSRGDEPRITTNGLTAKYYLPQESAPAAHTNFWDYVAAYGWNLLSGIGLTGKGITGTLDAAADHFIATGVPVVDVNDDGVWDPYPFFVVQVQDNTGNTLVETVNVAPASTEMSCYLCHIASDTQGVFASILHAHDSLSNTGLVQLATDGKPILCNSCHADPAMGVTQNKDSQTTLSGAMHTFHADKLTASQVPPNACQACHPGPQTQCLRDVMASQGITCTDCHGGMSEVGDPARTPWVNLPTCSSCHTQALTKSTSTHIENPNQVLTQAAEALYQNSKAHGGGGIYCPACHGSPHAIYPTITARDNEQSIRLQGHAGPIVECEVCHTERPEEAFWHIGGGD